MSSLLIIIHHDYAVNEKINNNVLAVHYAVGKSLYNMPHDDEHSPKKGKEEKRQRKKKRNLNKNVPSII